MRVFVPQKANAPATKTTETCWEVSAGITGKIGIKAEVEAIKFEAEAGAELDASISFKSCSEWTDLPGGYNVYLSVFD
jgi:hypothetical protein